MRGRWRGGRAVRVGVAGLALAMLALAMLARAVPAALAPPALRQAGAPELPAPSPGVRLDGGRFTVVAEAADARLARSLLSAAQSRDSFPGLPRPTARVLIAVAPDAERFRRWVGPGAPEWGAAIAFPDQQRVIMQGRFAGSAAGDPVQVLRHELAHLALHESLGWRAPRWFDEGYASVAAGEWTREVALETAVGLVWRTLPPLDSVEAGFFAGAEAAAWSYTLAHRAVSELEALDPVRGLAPLLAAWRTEGSLERALRRGYGMTGEQFDRRWRDATRRRYGALALLANFSLAAGVFGVLLGPLFVLRRRRDRQRLAALRAADAAQEAAFQGSALEALLALPAADGAGGGAASAVAEPVPGVSAPAVPAPAVPPVPPGR